ncbi:NC domain protein [Roseateles toxinivorans]|uniref:NC domain protein n=1 Tax=Roseateles toxinivorans TaxID=270368 RepID=UPI00105E4219|nr:NC domain protein [Roseateles toxinivorans]
MVTRQAPIRVIARAKLSGIGDHVGVQLPDGRVAHRTPEGNEVVSLEEFAQGRKLRELRRASLGDYGAILQRVAESMQASANYRLGDNNCEHYASFLMGELPRSPQMQGLATLAAIGAVLVLAK